MEKIYNIFVPSIIGGILEGIIILFRAIFTYPILPIAFGVYLIILISRSFSK